MTMLNGTQPPPAAAPASTLPTPSWRISFRGHEWTSNDVTTAQAVAVAEIIGHSDWRVASPTSGPTELGAWLTVLLTSVTGGDLAACQQLVLATPLHELVDALNGG